MATIVLQRAISLHLARLKLREEGNFLLRATLRRTGPKSSRQTENGKTDRDHGGRTFLIAAAMEEPLGRAIDYAAALELVGYGLNRIGDDHGQAVRAIAEAITADLASVQRSWRQIMAASSSAQRKSKRRPKT